MNPNQSYPSTGEVIDGKYQIEKLLGEGGMGAVAKATHILRRAPVALKFMSPNVVSVPGAVERFLNEGVAASQIESDNVVHVFDVGKLSNGAPYLVMEYMEGHDLAEVIAREGHPGLEPQRAVYFIVQALRGLQVAHDAGIIHRDMKPSNCFVVNKEGEADFVKLLDFGISKVGSGKSASLTQTNSALGTPLYMSPEQARSPRDVDLRSDLYSVGVILYELLTGRTPFASESGEFTEILFKLFTQEPPPIRSLRSDLSPELAAAVHKALAREPNDRYSTAAEFALALEPFADQRSTRVLQRIRTHQPGRGSHVPSTASHGCRAGRRVLQAGARGSGSCADERHARGPRADARGDPEDHARGAGHRSSRRQAADPPLGLPAGRRLARRVGRRGGRRDAVRRARVDARSRRVLHGGVAGDGAGEVRLTSAPRATRRSAPRLRGSGSPPSSSSFRRSGFSRSRVLRSGRSRRSPPARPMERRSRPSQPPRRPRPQQPPRPRRFKLRRRSSPTPAPRWPPPPPPRKRTPRLPPPVPQQPGPPQRPSDGKTHLKDIQIHE